MSRIQIISPGEVRSATRVAIIAGRYNEAIVERLVEGCLTTLSGQGLADDNILLVRVPGAFELPVLAGRLAASGEYDVIIALGAVIRGETSHFDFVAGECASGLSRVALDHNLPVIFGVLTADTEQQALERAGEGDSNKGVEAAMTALEMAAVFSKVGT